IATVPDLISWGDLRNALVGRTSGRLTDIMSALGSLPKEDRRAAGQLANATKIAIDELLEKRHAELAGAAKTISLGDPTMPARESWRGSVHPVSLVIDEISEIFRELGFSIALGPEAETEGYNFTGVSFPADHPAMELHDTLYLQGGGLLRTHTSPVQIRTLQKY